LLIADWSEAIILVDVPLWTQGSFFAVYQAIVINAPNLQ